jgi:hypothetical protein
MESNTSLIATKLQVPIQRKRMRNISSSGVETRRKNGRVDTKRDKLRKKAKSQRTVKLSLALLERLLSTDLGTEASHPLYEDDSLNRVEAKLLRRSFLKKFEGATSKLADRKSISEFLSRNEQCGSWSYQSSALFDDEIDGEVKSILARAILPDYDSTFGLAEISAGFQVGPGASVGSEEDDFLTKIFHSPLTSTNPDLYTYYVHAIRGSSWAAGEKSRYAQYGLQIVVGNQLSTVPKTVDETRVICTEPLLNMLFQKGIGQFLEGSLRRSFGIDIRRGVASTQPEINRELARLGSMTEGRKSFCTIDLKGASDSVSTRLCDHLLPGILNSWLKIARSPTTILPDGTRVELNMISSMGNAFTFPLQTILFASIVKACYRILGIQTPRCNSVEPTYGVFGDDIVCIKDAYEVVRRALVRYGFTVNDEKSFSSGSFRESCGGDFWRGHLVRGVYVKRLTTEPDVYSALNRLVRWSVRSGLDLDLTLWYLISRIRRALLYVPYQEGDTGGLKVPENIAQIAAYDYWTRSPMYRALQPKPRTYAVPDQAITWSVKNGHHRCYNGDGILVAMCGGFIRDGRIGLREKSDTPAFIVHWRSVPDWDYVSKAEALLLRGSDWKVRAAEILTGLVGT